MKMIFDTHAHYDDSAFNNDRDFLLKSLFDGDVCAVVNQGTDTQSSQKSILLAEQYENVFAAVGLHPEYLDENSMNELPDIRRMAMLPKTVAIGEIGLDYHYNVPKTLQKQVFSAQLRLANELSLPVVIHDREAHGDTLEMLKYYRPEGILHCFSGSVEMSREIVKLGMYIGIGGTVTFKNARKTVDVVRETPLERIVLETDCPYLAPVPNRGKRNDSSMIRYTAERVAEIKGVDLNEVLATTKKNAETVYNIY